MPIALWLFCEQGHAEKSVKAECFLVAVEPLNNCLGRILVAIDNDGVAPSLKAFDPLRGPVYTIGRGTVSPTDDCLNYLWRLVEPPIFVIGPLFSFTVAVDGTLARQRKRANPIEVQQCCRVERFLHARSGRYSLIKVGIDNSLFTGGVGRADLALARKHLINGKCRKLLSVRSLEYRG